MNVSSNRSTIWTYFLPKWLTYFLLCFLVVYKSEVIDGMREPGGFIDWWGHRFLASNIVMADTDEPLGNRFMMLEGKNSQVLVFGFIYHLLDPADTVIVNDPADEVKDPWFEAALRENTFDAILVMAHMGVDDESITVIRDAIRAVVGGGVPIEFVAGHTHLLRWAKVDDLSTAVEAGKYLDTVGFLSFPTKQTAEITAPESYIDLFQYTFVDANVNYMKYALDGEYGFTTPDGEDLSEFIVTTQYEMGLLDIVGCAPNNYFMNRSLTDVDSLWAIYQKQVVPTQLGQDPAVNRAIIVSQDSWRYDIFEGDNTYDDVVAISPFNESIYFVGIVPCDAINQLYEKLNADAGDLYYPVLPAYILAGKLVPGEDCELYTHHFELSAISEGIQSVQPGTYEVSATNLTSTSIWIDFFRSEWPCAGQTRIHIPWLDDHKLIDENGQANKKNVAIVTSVSIVSILVFCGLLTCCRYAIKQMCFGKQAVSEEEMDAFNEDGQIEAEFA